MSKISFNDLPQAIEHLTEELQCIKKILLECFATEKRFNESKSILTAKETAKYLNITLPTLHNWVKQGKISKLKIGGRRTGYKLEDVKKLCYMVESKKSY
ncbi:MAG: helix-turn-helix domain-containing protein [Saprospiraceae bacterium]|nr:helix-turn-helix domain-containing protein [Saprospiraceae bacterium]